MLRRTFLKAISAILGISTLPPLEWLPEKPLTPKERDEIIAKALETKEGRYIYRLEEALRRLYNDPKTFGDCHTCGSAVGYARLDALPHARYCIDCKRKEEDVA